VASPECRGTPDHRRSACDDFADLIEPFSRRGVDLGLERLQAALAELGHPEQRFAAVQVAGTNGKGSIATLVHQGLLAAGLRVGLYTSPHLVSWCERVRLGADLIAPAVLRRHLEAATPVARSHQLTPFELVTAAAFLAFAEAELELAVLEVGLGGRLDATTCHPDRGVIGLASVGLDHCEFLGPDLSSIAAEKAGVLLRGSVAISAPQVPAVAAVFEQRALAVGAELRWVDPLPQAADGSLLLNGGGAHGPGEWGACGLGGAVQGLNGAVAQGVLQALAERGWPIKPAAILAGFAAARWPGRLQPLNWRGVPLLLDGAHNLPAAQALRRELDGDPQRYGLASGRRHWVIGILANKQGPAILETLLGPTDCAWIVPVAAHISWSHGELVKALPQLASQLLEAADWQQAVQAASAPPEPSSSAGGDGATAHPSAPVVIAGSLYLIGQLLSAQDQASIAP